MADTKLSALTELTTGNIADTDEVYVRDVSEVPASESKRTLFSSIKTYIQNAFATVFLELDGTNAMTGALDLGTVGQIDSGVADGASAVAFDLNTDNAFSTAGSKLFQVKNNGTAKFYIEDDGRTIFAGNGTIAIIGPTAASGEKLQISVNNDTFGGIELEGERDFDLNEGQNDGSWDANSTLANVIRARTTNRNLIINMKDQNTACLLGLKGQSAVSGNTAGGKIKIEAGDGTGTGNGGDIEINGGIATGTGSVGNIIMDTLPTSNPTVAGALWNDAGTLKVSAG